MKFLVILALMFGISACSTTVIPETPTERYVVADGAFKVILATVRDAAQSGRIPAEAVPRLKTALIAAKVALDAWGKFPANANAEVTALLALQAARALLLSFEASTAELAFGTTILAEKAI